MQLRRVLIRRFSQYARTRHQIADLFEAESRLNPSWENELVKVSRPSAASLVAKLMPNNSLGFPGAIDSTVITGRVKDQSKLRVVDLATMWKDIHPDMVLLVRMGDFYEAWGVDAVMLVEHAGLNPMGDSLRAGCPKGNIQQTLNSLTDAGLSVAVFEEANVVGSRSKKIRKERYLSQVVTPGRPIYLHDTCLREGELPYRASKPYAAIRCTRDGCSLAFIWVDAKEVRVTDSLTEEAVGSLIEGIGGVTEPVWVAIESGSANLKFSRLKSVLPSKAHKLPIRLSQESFLSAVIEDITRHLSLGPHSEFSILKDSAGNDPYRLRPLHASAAQFLGLSPTHPPDLIKYMLPPSAPFYCNYFLRNWLLCPPRRELTDAMHRLIQQVENLTDCAVPKYRVVPVDKLVRPLETRNGNFHFFADLFESCGNFITTPDPLLTSIDLMAIARHLSGLTTSMSVEALLADAKNIRNRITAALFIEGPEGSRQTVASEALDRFIRSKESEFINTVRCDFATLAIARERLVDAMNRSLVSPDKSLRYDQISDKLYVKDVDVALRGEARKRPIPDDGSRKRHSTDLIMKAEADYRTAAEDAKNISKQVLENLCCELGDTRLKQSLIFFSHWAVVVSSLALHVENSLRKGWTIPHLTDGSSEIDSAWPFWLDPLPHGSAVANSCTLQKGSVAILTAPNMSGKSTLIRTIGVVSLLANAGLMVPAKHAKIHKISNLLVVSPNGDRPVEGLSAFAAEADAMSVAIRESAPKGGLSQSTLLLIDEFGRGTSGRDASALSAAAIEWVSKQNHVACIWATHLHELFGMPQLEINKWIQMEGFKLLAGKCTDSKGIETALERGFPKDIVNAAFLIRNGPESISPEPIESSRCPVKRLQTRLFPDTGHVGVIELDPGLLPPPSLQSSALVYVLRFSGEKYYVGETEDFRQRIKAHKKRFKAHPEKIWIIKQPDKTQARALETSLIQAFLADGVALLSTTDGSHRLSSSVIR